MQQLPWFIRVIDRLVGRHERWISELRDGPKYHRTLLEYALTGNERSRAWLAEALSRYEFARASRFWMWYLLVLLTVGFFIVAVFGARGCGLVLLLSLLTPVFQRFDRWNRRRIVWNRLPEGKATVYRKVEVKDPPEGSRIFQSYWSMDGPGTVELDHPIEMREIVEKANEWWQWQMPTPHDDNGGIKWLNVNYDLGLVHRDETGARRLLAGGVVYFSYDPWANRIDTSGYE